MSYAWVKINVFCCVMRIADVNRFLIVNLSCLLVACTSQLFAALDLKPVETLDDYLGDKRIYWSSPIAAKQRDDITVILIKDETLLDYEADSPINRSLLSRLIKEIDNAKPLVMGLDFIFDRRTSHDKQLLASIKEAKSPLILGSIFKLAAPSPESFTIQNEFLEAAKRPYGHIMLGREKNIFAENGTAVRYIANPENITHAENNIVANSAFVDVIAREIGLEDTPKSSLISWERPPKHEDLFTTLLVPRHNPEDLPKGNKNLLPDSWMPLLENRIVLIGADLTDRDQHLTPLSVVDKKMMAGIFIHAQALAARIDGNRDQHTLPNWAVWFILFIIARTSFALQLHLSTITNTKGNRKNSGYARRHIFRKLGIAATISGKILKTIESRKIMLKFIVFIFFGFMSFFALVFFKLDIQVSILTTAWILGFFAPRLLINLRMIKLKRET